MLGQSFRLAEAIRVAQEEDGAAGFRLLPPGSIIVPASFHDGGTLVRVECDGTSYLVFSEDMQRRAIPILE